jgi:hypothetical protein
MVKVSQKKLSQSTRNPIAVIIMSKTRKERISAETRARLDSLADFAPLTKLP